jgi:glycosyltransferase involved in cell wall biosynthesis
LHDALASVYAQTIRPDEVLVVNDGSTDGTESVLRSLEATLPASFKWVSRQNTGGPAGPRNFGIGRTAGEYVAFLDQDDAWYPTKLERQLEHFRSDPDLALSFTGYKRVEGDTAQLVQHDDWDPNPAVVLEKLMHSVAVGPTSTVVIRRRALEQVPPFDEGVSSGDDWKMWLRIAAAGLKIDYLPNVLAEYRWHGSNLSLGESKHFDIACLLFDRFFNEPGVPPSIRRHGPRWRARWHMLTAIHAIQRGDKRRARSHIAIAARLHPPSIRPGWVRMLGLGKPPREADRP